MNTEKSMFLHLGENIKICNYVIKQQSPNCKLRPTGLICNGAVSADSVAPLYALDAKPVLRSKNGNQEFHTGPGKTIRKSNEILTEILIPQSSYKGKSGCYENILRALEKVVGADAE